MTEYLPAELYADAAASYPPLHQALGDTWDIQIRNPNSVHIKGRNARAKLEEARERIADCIRAEPRQIGFTPSATAACEAYFSSKITGFYGSPHEHKAVREWSNPFAVKYAQEQALMLANNETGEIYEDEIKNLAENGKIVFTDATAAMGHIPVDVRLLGVDGLVAGAHKFGGLCGIGFLYKREGFRDLKGNIADPFPGTVPVFLADVMANALEYRVKHMYESEKLSSIREELEEKILKVIPGSHINAYGKRKLPGIISARFDGIPASSLITSLDALGLYVSAGAACSGNSTEPSRTLLADGLTDEQALSTIRISMYEETPPGTDIFILDALKCAVAHFRGW